VIYKRGKSWRVIVYVGRDPLTGKQVRKGGSAPTRAEAKVLEARLITEAAAGQHRGDRKRTVAELLERWFEWRQGVRPIAPRTVDNYRRDMDRFNLPALGKLPVARLDAAILDRFYTQLRKQGGKDSRPLAPSTVREVHAILSGALRQAAAWGWITHNPAGLATPPAVEKAKVRPPEVNQVAQLLQVAAEQDPAADAYVFSHAPDGRMPIRPDSITHRFTALAKRLGVACRLHDLRHFMVTQLVAGLHAPGG
jgi:integrase